MDEEVDRVEWRELEAFLVLADELHFGRTADRLFTSRARVSQNISTFERRIGAKLFERTSRKVLLTEIGRRLREDLEAHHRGIQLAVDKARDAARGIAGRLGAGYSGPWSADLLHVASDRFHLEHPGCEVRVQEVHISDPLAALRAGDIDVQLTEFPVDEPDLRTGGASISMGRCLAVPARHPFTRRASISLEDLAGEVLLMFAGDTPEYWQDHHYPPHTPSGRPIERKRVIRFWQDGLALVAQGKGVTIAATGAARYYSRPDLAYVPFHDAPPLEYGLVWRKAAETPLLMGFITAMDKVVAEHGGPASFDATP